MKSSINMDLPYLIAECSIKAPAWFLVKVLPFSQHLIKYISVGKIVKSLIPSSTYTVLFNTFRVKQFSTAPFNLIQGVLSDTD